MEFAPTVIRQHHSPRELTWRSSMGAFKVNPYLTLSYLGYLRGEEDRPVFGLGSLDLGRYT